MCNISQSLDKLFEVNCVPRSEVIVLDTPKEEIQEKTKALAHAAADASDKFCFHPFRCAINDSENEIATATVL
jgi:hypothetical protein